MQYNKWIQHPDYNYLLVSELGEIAKLLKPQKHDKGYLRAKIKDSGKLKFIYIHRLVAETFIVNPDGRATINHKNRIVSDNRVSNLEWMTNYENLIHRHSTRKPICEPTIDYTGELWSILNMNEEYIISNMGRVAKVIKTQTNEKGYIKTKLFDNGKRTDKYVHRLVAETWLQKDIFKPHVNHKNLIKSDNRVANLEWISHLENVRHSFKHNLNRKKRDISGSKNPNSKLKDTDVVKIVQMIKEGKPLKSIGKLFGVTDSMILHIKKGSNWKHIA